MPPTGWGEAPQPSSADTATAGRRCNARDLYGGVNLGMGLLACALGAANLLVAQLPGAASLRSLAGVGLATSVVMGATALRAFPPTPIVLLSAAVACYSAALLA